ncbi:arylformamidase [soil metagenome]
MRVFDISPTLSPRTAVFPGDVAFKRDVSMSFEAGHHLGLSSISTTLHIGAHADSSSHYSSQGEGIDRRGLGHYVGRAYVARAKVARGKRVRFEDLSDLARLKIESNEEMPSKFLIWTGTFPDPSHWNSDFASYDPALIERLAARGVITIGIDTPSIDPETSKALESHHTIERLNLAVLEGLCLDGVPEGEYTLMAQPLKIEGGDAGPVRAILFDGRLVESNLQPPLSFTWIECEKKPKP